MNKITKLLVAFVTVTSFSLTSCEPDYVTDGSTTQNGNTDNNGSYARIEILSGEHAGEVFYSDSSGIISTSLLEIMGYTSYTLNASFDSWHCSGEFENTGEGNFEYG